MPRTLEGPSYNLTWKELACKDGTQYPERFINEGTVYNLANMFELIRHLIGDKSLIINSAFRTYNWNKKIGGAVNSQHLYGRALDIEPPNGMTVNEFYNIIHANHRELRINGLGKYNTFVHCDIRSTRNDRLVVWQANGIKDSGRNA